MIDAILVDDEENALKSLALKINRFYPNFNIINTFQNPTEAVAFINNNKPDILFLDVEMPVLSGFDILAEIENPDFEIIFVTAYNEYAIQAFEVSAIDYLLKPVRIDLLENAILKLEKKLESSTMFERLNALKTNLGSENIEKIAIPVSDGLVFVTLDLKSLNY
mgnify:CR=1 FL=1